MIPEHLRSTCALLAKAYPTGVPEADYFAALALLHAHFSDRNLAEVACLALGREMWTAYNDVLGCLSTQQPSSEDLARVHARLLTAGFEAWCREEDV